jgi:benzoylformate decarboxylase
VAATPPYGPVFVALPMDVLDQPNTEPAEATVVPSTRTVPDAAELLAVASRLARAQRPLLVVGDGVAASGANAALAAFAELLGAPVHGANWSEVNLAADHPAYAGMFGHMTGGGSTPVTAAADAVVVVGTSIMPEVFPDLDGVFADDAVVVHIDLDPWEFGKNFTVDHGFVADPARTLAQLGHHLDAVMSDDQRAAAAARTAAFAGPGGSPPRRPTLDAVLDAVTRLAPEAVVFDEAITASPNLQAAFRPGRPGSYHLTRGGSLGVGFPGAVGLQLARPGERVIGFAGDGGSMYTFQALWTAARYDVPATFVVCNNGRYQILADNLDVYRAEVGLDGGWYPDSFDISRPPIAFAELASSLGVEAATVTTPEGAAGAVAKALDHHGPFLLDVDSREA